MPNRLFRDGWLDSESVDKLSADAERFFLRLCLAADDAGRFDGRKEILRARLFPLKASLRVSDVERWTAECAAAGLAIPYEWDGKPYLQITKVQRSSPCARSKFPWVDGCHEIEYVKVEHRDGREFVRTSLVDGMRKGSVRDTNGLDGVSAQLPVVVVDVVGVVGDAVVGEGSAPPRTGSGASRRKPANVEECITMGDRLGLTPQECRDWFRDMEAANWAKTDGTPFGNWPREMAIHRDRLRSRPPATNGHGSPSGAQMIVWQRQLESVEKDLHASRPEGLRDLTPEEKDKRRKLKATLQDLKTKLGIQT